MRAEGGLLSTKTLRAIHLLYLYYTSIIPSIKPKQTHALIISHCCKHFPLLKHTTPSSREYSRRQPALNMEYPEDHHAGLGAASLVFGYEASDAYLADDELQIDKHFLKPLKITETDEDLEDTFDIIDKYEAMTSTPPSSISSSYSDLQVEIYQASPPARKSNLNRAIKRAIVKKAIAKKAIAKKAIVKDENAKHLTKGVGLFAKSVFGLFGMVRATGPKNNLPDNDVIEPISGSQVLTCDEDGFQLVGAEDQDEARPLDLEPEDFVDYPGVNLADSGPKVQLDWDGHGLVWAPSTVEMVKNRQSIR